MATSQPAQDSDTKLVTSLLTLGLTSYQWGKAVALAQAPGVETPLKWIEDKVVETTTLGLKKVALTPEIVVTKLDDKAAEVVTSYKLDERFASAKTEAAKQLLKLKGEDALTAELASEIELQQLIADAREVAWERVAGIQTQASDRVDTLLSNAETYVAKVLPAEETEEGSTEMDTSTKVARVRTLSSTVSRRFKKKAIAKLEGVTLKLRESSAKNPIVHLDLVRYSELLDLAAVRDRLHDVGEKVTSTETFAVVKGYVVETTNKTEKLAEGVKSNVRVRVLTPAKEFYATAAAEFIKRKQSAGDLYKLGSEEYQIRRVNTIKYIESLKVALGSAWDERLYSPAMKFLEACETEFAPFKRAYREGVENPNVTTPDGKPYTIEGGLEAFVTALRLKLAEEWETRVVPTLERFKAKVTKDEVFVDAEE